LSLISLYVTLIPKLASVSKSYAKISELMGYLGRFVLILFLCSDLFALSNMATETQSVVTQLKLLRQPTFFSGLEGHSINEWLLEYNMIFDASSVSDAEKAKYLPLYLSGTPLLWFRSLAAADRASMSDLEKSMRAKFSPHDIFELAQRNLWQRSLLPAERMVDYVYAKLELCRCVETDMPEESKIKWLVRGLPHFYRERLRGTKSTKVDDLTTELLELETFYPEGQSLNAVGSNREEMKHLIREVISEHEISQRDANCRQNDSQAKPTSAGFSGENRRDGGSSTRYSQTRARFHGTCWRCGLVGHSRANCRVNLQRQNLNERGVNMRGDMDSRAGRNFSDRR